MSTPTPAPSPLPNVQLSYGPMLVGVFMNLILYGVLLSQTLTYYQMYFHKDALWIRLFVGCLFVIETANTALDMAMMYQPLILEYGHNLVYFPTVFMTQPLCVVLISMPIQIFFAWRIFQLTHSSWIPAIISVFSVASFAGGVWTATKVEILREFAKKPLLHKPALLWFLASCVADVLITVSLVKTLMSKKTGFVATDSVLDKIIRTTIQTGMITAIFSILDVVCFMAFPHIAVNFVWDLALSKLYSNCLMSTLNARQRLANASHASTFQQQQPRNVVFSGATGQTRETGAKQDRFLDPLEDSMKDDEAMSMSASIPTALDLEYGIRMTRTVEQVTDPLPEAR